MAISTSPIRQSTGTGSSGLTVTQATQPTNGNILVLLVACESVNINPISASRVNNVSSTGTAWYHIANAINTWGYPFLTIEIWWGKVGDSAGGIVTVSFNLPVSNTVGNLTEWSGVRVATSPVDIANSNSGQSTTPAVPADFTSGGYGSGEELVIIASAAMTATPPSANPVSYTSLTAVTNISGGGYGLFVKGGYWVPVAAGTNVGGGTWTISASGEWGVVIGSLHRGPQTTSQTFTAHAHTMNATLAKQDRKPLAGSTATMAAAMATLKGTATQFQTLTAGLSAFVAGILKQIDKGFNAS
jgi:hypothetical protein